VCRTLTHDERNAYDMSGKEVLPRRSRSPSSPGSPRSRRRGRHELRNVREPIELFAAVPLGGRSGGYVIDPVCNMVVDPDRAAGRLVHERKAYFFCTLSCAAAFARDPERFAE